MNPRDGDGASYGAEQDKPKQDSMSERNACYGKLMAAQGQG